DGDCAAEERCTSVRCTNTTTCAYDSKGDCMCGGPTICGTNSFCNPTSKVGQAGNWVTLTVNRGSGPCPPGEVCSSFRTVAADGTFTGRDSATPVSGSLDDLDLMELKHLVNGPDFRNALKDGIPCDQPPTDIGIDMKLELSTGTLEREVTGCVLTGP